MKTTINNALVKSWYTLLEEAIKNTKHQEHKQLRYCQATVAETEYFYILWSYNTPIAAINKATGVCIDFLRLVYGYTATSAQHIAKFCSDYNATEIVRYKD